MRKTDKTYILGIVFAAATSVFYCCVRWFKITMLRYYPLENTWKWGKQGGPSQAWYSIQTFAFICGGIVTLVFYLALKYACSQETELKPLEAKWLGIAGTVLIVVCMAYIIIYEYGHWGILG